jgi:hypothetical protein
LIGNLDKEIKGIKGKSKEMHKRKKRGKNKKLYRRYILACTGIYIYIYI